jgi:hypothetical protein
MAACNLDGAEHTTRPYNREAAVTLFGHFVQRATRPTKNRAPVRLSRLIKQTKQI